MKKILFYLPFIKVGGIEKIAISHIKIMVKKGWCVDLLIDFDMGSDINLLEKDIPREVGFRYVKSRRSSNFLYRLRTLGKRYKVCNILLLGFMVLLDFYYYYSKVKKIIDRGNYDYSVSFYQFLPSYLTGVRYTKHIIWLHGSIEHFFSGFGTMFKNRYERKLEKYDYIVTIANQMKEQLENFYPDISKEKIKMIYNPFDFNEIKRKSDCLDELNSHDMELLNDKYMCTVSRIDEHQKDLTTLILSYADIFASKKGKLEKLYIVGDGPSREALESLVKKKKLESQILFLGGKSNPFVWMKNAEIFILSSKFEGLPTVLIEAMAVHTFVISSNCKTGPVEIIQNARCGDLFDVGNIEELSNKINHALSDRQYRNEKILKANERLKEFDSVNVSRKLLELFD